MLRSLRPSLALLAAGVLLAACDGGGGTDFADEPAVSGDEVSVVDNAFEPANLEVAAGDEVTWVWEGSAAHDVVGDDFDSGVQRDGTFTHTFDEPGTYDYECQLHNGMDGRITVVEP